MNRSTLIALAAFAALSIAFIATRERQVTVGVHKLELSPVNADSITELSFGPLALRQENGAWQVITADKHHPADEGQVKAAQQALADLKADDFVTDRPEKHAELEVDAARGLTIKASTATGVVRDLVLGKASRSGGAYLRETKSNAVFATTGGLGYLARRDLAAWRKKTISTAKVEDITRLTLTPPAGAPWSLASADGTWKLEAETAKDYRFDAAQAQRLVGQFANLSAQDFTDGPVDPPLTQVKADLKDGKSVSLRVGAKRADGTHALAVDGDPQTYLMRAWQVEQLLEDPEGLRDLRLLHFEPAQVERLTLVSAGKKTVITKGGESWKLVEPKTYPEFDAQQVGSILTRLASLRGAKVVRDVPDAKAGLGSPTVQLELGLQGGATQRLRLGGAAGTEVYAKGDDVLLFTANAQEKTWLEGGVDLFKRPPPSPGFQGGNGMSLDQLPPEIRQQLEAQLRQQQR